PDALMNSLVVRVPERHREARRATPRWERGGRGRGRRRRGSQSAHALERARLRLVFRAGLAAYLLALMAGAVIETPELARQGGSFLVHAGAFALSQLFVFLLAPRWRARFAWLGALFLFGVLIEAV